MKLACPKCAVEIPPENANIAEGILSCPQCGEFFRISSLLNGDAAPARVEKPPQSNIELACEGDSLGLLIPPGRNRSGGIIMIVFGLVWAGITLPGLFAALSTGFAGLIIIPFVLVGLVIFALGLLLVFGEFTLLLDRHECRAMWTVFKWKLTKRIAIQDITDVTEEVTYTKNHQPVYGVAIRHGAKALKFGSGLTKEERAWLISELRQFLRLDEKRLTV